MHSLPSLANPGVCRRLTRGVGLVILLGGIQSLTALEEVYVKNCASCHGPDGHARTPAARKLAVKDLTLSKLTEPEILQTLQKGRVDKRGQPTMPAFGDKLSDSDLRTLVKVVTGFRK